MQINLIIKSQKSEEIVFGELSCTDAYNEQEKVCIKNIEFFMDTVDDNVTKKNDAMLAKIKVTGIISKETNSRVQQLFRWSIDNSDSIYRDITVILSDNKVALRTYEFKNMFVVDYKENIVNDGNNGDESTFEMCLTQERNHLGSIDTY